jgi:NADH-quinone oxidoreductase subunit G
MFVNYKYLGALTSKPYAFVARPWELNAVISVDIFDSYLTSVRIDMRGTEVMRILPLASGLRIR